MRNVSCLWLVVAIAWIVSGCASASANHDAWFGQDKFLHCSVAAAIGAGSSAVARTHGASESGAAVIGVSMAVGMGAVKELFDDRVQQSYWSWKDMFWNTVGGTVGSLAGAKCR